MGVNRGVIDAHRRGVLTSATLLVNFPAHTDAASLAQAHPALGMGLHLNVAHGQPVSVPERIPSLVSRDGTFPGPAAVLRRLLLGRIRRSEVDIELKAQLKRFRDALGEPTHLDSHKHLHLFGCFVDAVASLARELPVPRVRCPLPYAAWSGWKSRIMRWAGRRAAGVFASQGVRFPDAFLGENGIAGPARVLLPQMIGQLPDGVTELMVHPGYSSPDEHDVVRGVAVTKNRKSDLDALTDASLKILIDQQEIELIHYGGI